MPTTMESKIKNTYYSLKIVAGINFLARIAALIYISTLFLLLSEISKPIDLLGFFIYAVIMVFIVALLYVYGFGRSGR